MLWSGFVWHDFGYLSFAFWFEIGFINFINSYYHKSCFESCSQGSFSLFCLNGSNVRYIGWQLSLWGLGLGTGSWLVHVQQIPYRTVLSVDWRLESCQLGLGNSCQHSLLWPWNPSTSSWLVLTYDTLMAPKKLRQYCQVSKNVLSFDTIFQYLKN